MERGPMDVFMESSGQIEERVTEVEAMPSTRSGETVVFYSVSDFQDDDDDMSETMELSDEMVPVLSALPAQAGPAKSHASESHLILQYLKGEVTFDDLAKSLTKEEPAGDVDDAMTLSELPGVSGSSLQSTPKGTAQRKKPRGHKSHLARDLQGLMGEANLQFARGNQEEAIKMCMEVVRLAPNAPEPFQTISMIYEEQGLHEKSLQYGLIGAHLNPRLVAADEWEHLAETCVDQRLYEQAIKCYNKAISKEPNNQNLVTQKLLLHEVLGNHKEVFRTYEQMKKIKITSEADACTYLSMTRKIAKVYHTQGNTQRATEVIGEALKSNADYITSEDVNVAAELNISLNDYSSALQILFDHCGVSFLYEEEEDVASPVGSVTLETSREPASLRLPDGLPIDLKAKLVVLLIYLGHTPMEKPVLGGLMSVAVDEVGDLYLDIAEVYMEKGYYGEALPLLTELIGSDKYSSLAAIWLRYAECLNALGELQNAAQAYKHVIDLAPSHMGARVSYANIKQQLGKHDEALQVLLQTEEGEDMEVDLQDARLYLHRTLILISQDRYLEACHSAKILMFPHFNKSKMNPELMKSLCRNESTKGRLTVVKDFCGRDFYEKYIKKNPLFKGQGPVCLEDLWEIFMKVSYGLYAGQHYEELIHFLCLGLTVYHFHEPKKQQEIEWLCIVAALMSKKGEIAYCFTKAIVKNSESNFNWNLFCRLQHNLADTNQIRFLIRQFTVNPNKYPLAILNANNSMTSGSYKAALGDYIHAWKMHPEDPFVNLQIGLVFVHMACQKYPMKKHTLVIQGLGFLDRYLQYRGDCQEVNYNMGRALHQLGLSHAAIFYYEKVLAMEPSIHMPGEETFDLRFEAAFNLALIYRKSNSDPLAQALLMKYCVI